MPLSLLDTIIRDIKDDKNVAARVKKVLSLPSSELSRKERLEFTLALLDETTFKASRNAHSSFMLGISSLRDLAPHLKSDGLNTLETTASIEKRSVNHANHVLFDDKNKTKSIRDSARNLLDDSLRIILQARQPQKGRKVTTRTKRGNPRQKSDFSNLSPRILQPNDAAFDLCIFNGASELGVEGCLPNKDGSTVASVVGMALVGKLRCLSTSLQLSELLAFTTQFVVPWVRFAQIGKKSQTFKRAMASIQTSLFEAARAQRQDPSMSLRLRAFALTLVDISLSSYAREVLRSVQFFIYAKTEQQINIHDVIGSVYDEALEFASSYDLNDKEWLDEDTSAWLDSVAVVWQKRSGNHQPPSIFARRLSLAHKSSTDKYLTEIYELQMSLIQLGVYNLNSTISSRGKAKVLGTQKFEQAVNELESLESIPSFSALQQPQPKKPRSSPFRNPIQAGRFYLRLLRVLDPIRREISTSLNKKCPIPPCFLYPLEAFISTFIQGLTSTGMGDDKKSNDVKLIKELRNLVCKKAKHAVETCAELARYHFKTTDESELTQLVSIIQCLFMELSKTGQSFSKEKRWLVLAFMSELRKSFKYASTCSSKRQNRIWRSTVEISEECEMSWFQDDPRILGYDLQLSLFDIIRHCYIGLKDWNAVANAALFRLNALMSQTEFKMTEEREQLLRKARQDCVKDLLMVFKTEKSPTFSTFACPPEYILNAVADYCVFLRSNTELSREKLYATMHQLFRLRSIILKSLADLPVYSSCHQRGLHTLWLQSLLNNGKIEKKQIQKLKNLAGNTYSPSHTTLTSFTTISSPDDRQKTYYGALFNAFVAANEGDWDVLGTELTSARNIYTEDLAGDKELLCLSSEILNWIEYEASLNDLVATSSLAKELRIVCDKGLGIETPMTANENRCLFLGRIISPDDVWVSPKSAALCQTNPRNNLCTPPTPARRNEAEECIRSPSRCHELHEELVNANERLKDSLRALLQGNVKVIETPPKIYRIAGVEVDLGFEIKTPYGRAYLELIIALIESLYHLARVLLLAENLNDGRYYMQRCSEVAQLCLPGQSLFVSTVRAVEMSMAATAEPDEFPSDFSRFRQSDEWDPFSLRSLVMMKQTVAMSLLESSSNRLTCVISQETTNRVLRICDQIENSISSGHIDPTDKALSEAELNICRGLSFAFSPDNTKAIVYFTQVANGNDAIPNHMRAIASYFAASSMVRQEESSKRIQPKRKTRKSVVKTKKTTQRSVRAKGRKPLSTANETICGTGGVDLHYFLSRSLEEVNGATLSPRLDRRVWKMFATTDERNDMRVRALNNAIGCTFNIRWKSAMESKLRQREKSPLDTRRKPDMDDLDLAMRNLRIRGDENCSDRLLRLLRLSQCVVLGMTLDNAKENLMLWRLSPDGVLFSSVPLPYSNGCSFSAISRRMSAFMSDMKAMAFKAGDSFNNKEKQKWWNQRYALDDEVKDIVSAIESEWFDELKYLFVPCIFGSESSTPSSKVHDAHTFAKRCKSVLEQNEEDEDGNRCIEIHEEMSRGQLVLLLGTELEMIPWESLPLLRELEVGVSRVPSLSFLEHHLITQSEEVDGEDLFYVVNPGGDLVRTENTFQRHFGFERWDGCFGRRSKEEVGNTYNNQGIYLYCGHGAGEQYLSPRRFSKGGTAPIALLMGCSSARPTNFDMGDCESNGPAIDYLVQGSRAVVGNLWDVGDKDIDKFTSTLLREWLGVDEHGEVFDDCSSLAEAVAMSRCACRLPFLGGAASIVMGAPLIRASQMQ